MTLLPKDVGERASSLKVGDAVELLETTRSTPAGQEVSGQRRRGTVERVTSKRFVVLAERGTRFTFSRATGQCVADFPYFFAYPAGLLEPPPGPKADSAPRTSSPTRDEPGGLSHVSVVAGQALVSITEDEVTVTWMG